MKRFIAFLRAINISGHNLQMELLRQLFQDLGYAKVETFIASGNVIFETPIEDTLGLEQSIRTKLRDGLGYDVAVFIRTDVEVAAIAAYQPFSQAKMDAAVAFNVAFLSVSPDEQSNLKLMALISSIDDFHIYKREIYWICRKKQSESSFSNAVLEKTIGMQTSLRGINTIKKLSAKYPAS
ncbi:MAG: DUF1697 domain-containing protein [Chloroflexi bacterium]|nr:DUF1697 domain-containing protein [Chloroflexota bacterium]